MQRLDNVARRAEQLLRAHEPTGDVVALLAAEQELAQRREHAGSRAGRDTDVESQRDGRRQQQAHAELDAAQLDEVQPRPRPPLGIGGGAGATTAAGLGGRWQQRLQRQQAAWLLAHDWLRCVEYPLVLAPPAARLVHEP